MKIIRKLTGSLIFIVAAAVLNLCPHSAYAQFETSNYKIYDNPLLGIKFQYPNEWSSVLDQGNGGVWFALHNLTGVPYSEASSMLGVFMNDIQDNKTLKQFLREYMSQKTDIRYDTLKLNETKLGGIPAISATYEVTIPWNQSLFSKALTTIAIRGNSGYILDYQAASDIFDLLLPKVNGILKSFEVAQG